MNQYEIAQFLSFKNPKTPILLSYNSIKTTVEIPGYEKQNKKS
jgi:hypothetical protein